MVGQLTHAIGGRYAMGKAVFNSISQIFPQADFQLFTDSGHYPAEEESERFANIVTESLNNRKS